MMRKLNMNIRANRKYIAYQYNIGNFVEETLDSRNRNNLFNQLRPIFNLKNKGKIKYHFFFLLKEDIIKTI